MTEVAVETLRARGEPARYERLLGEVLVGLDRAGQLRRLATLEPASESDLGTTPAATALADPPADDPSDPSDPRGPADGGTWTGGPGLPDGRGERAAGAPPSEPVAAPGSRPPGSPRPTRSTGSSRWSATR